MGRFTRMVMGNLLVGSCLQPPRRFSKDIVGFLSFLLIRHFYGATAISCQPQPLTVGPSWLHAELTS